MIKKLFDWFAKSEEDNVNALPTEEVHKFVLMYKEIVIGYLEAEKGLWKFYYSSDFKENKELNYITGFPDLDKVYYSELLWPFFKIRIPGLGQPRVKKTIKKENISEKDEIALLKRFGKKSISNPYLLDPIS